MFESKRKRWVDSVNEAVKEIARFQSGEIKPLRTGIWFLDEICMGGLFPGDIITIGGKSGGGKSYLLQRIERNIFDLNPEAKIALLRMNFEMPVMKLLLNDLKVGTGLKMSDILLKKPENPEIFKLILDKQRSNNIYHIEIALNAADFFKETESFILDNLDKDNILVSIDHIALTGEKDEIDRIMKHCIYFKQKYKKITFIILTQLNRNINERTNPKDMAPRTSDIYESSSMEHASDIILIPHNPFLMGIEKYLSLERDSYAYLSDFFLPGKGKYANLDPFGNIFYHFVKIRTPDDTVTRTIFAERMVGYKHKMTDREYEKQPIPNRRDIIDAF